MNSNWGAQLQSERAQLERILNHYRLNTTLNTTVSLMVNDPKAHENFVICLQHDVRILSNRSQDVGNHECSTGQKALVILMKNEENIVAAANLYAVEILGFSAVPSDAETLKAQIKARKDIVESLYMLTVPHSAPPTLIEMSHNDVPSHAGQNPCKAQDSHDPKFARLWNLYETAKQELAAIPETQFKSHANAAKFLRDTVENCVDYLTAKQCSSSIQRSQVCWAEAQTDHDEKLLADLRIAFNEAKEAADRDYNGPRRFEQTGSSRRQPYRLGPINRHAVTNTSNQEPYSGRARAWSTSMGHYEVRHPRTHITDTRQSSQHLRRSASPVGRGGFYDAQHGHQLASNSSKRRAGYGNKVRHFGYRPRGDKYKPTY